MLKLIFLSFCIHLFLLLAVFDTFFQTIIESDLPLTNSTKNPPAKRILLIIVDGLRAQAILEENEYVAPFLTSMRKRNGSWGVSIGAAPTESRIGHTAIIGGFREDPRSLLNAWGTYLVKYDTVFEQSANTWCVSGDRSVGNIFTHYQGENVRVYSHQRNLFVANGDIWSIQNFTFLLKNNSNYGNFSKSGNIFAVLLPNLDVVAHHEYREYSKEVGDVDARIQNLTTTFKETFPDDSTTFLVTSDHGMRLDNGHGFDSPMEISTPFICWGAGVNRDSNRKDIENIDIAPLISVLIGINFPTNSRGIIPINYLNVSREEKYWMFLKNLYQIYNIYDKKQRRFSKRSLVWRDDLDMTKLKHMLKQMSYMNGTISDEAFTNIQNLMKIVLNAIDSAQLYYTYNVIFSGLLGLIFWILYLFSSFSQSMAVTKKDHFITKKFVLLFVFYVCSIILVSCSEIFFFIYYLFPLGSFCLLLSNYKEFLALFTKQYNSPPKFFILLFFCFYFSIVLGFRKREYFSLTILLMSPVVYIIPKDTTRLSETWKHTWAVLCSILALFPSTSFHFAKKGYLVHCVGGVLWHLLSSYYFFELIIIKKGLQITTLQYFISCFQNICSVIAVIIALYKPDVSDQYVYLIITASIPLLLIPFSMKIAEMRIFTIFMGMVSAFIIPSFPQELSILTIFSIVLINYSIVETNIISCGRQDLKNFRVCWIFIGLNIFCFSGMVNLSDIGDPIPGWIRWSGFIMNFEMLPFHIYIVKLMIPLLLTACSFRYIVMKTKVNLKICFMIIELFFSTMLFYIIFRVRNTGSWLDMGMSFINFFIVNFFALFSIFFYFISSVLMDFV